jgi:predicted nucleic acid-binding protein
MIVVGDSSALVALSVCQALPLLELLFEKIYVPEAVYKEVSIKGKSEADPLTDYLSARVKSVETNTFQVINSVNLGTGEQEAIALYMELSADLLIIDDARAKKIAYANGLEVMGSVGVLLLAKQRGLINKIKPMLNLLAVSDIHLGSNIIEKALKLADE